MVSEKDEAQMQRKVFEIKSYYRERAPVYDQVYTYPERQADLRFLEEYIPKQFVGLDVLEVAAGTGYWTQFVAATANSILAADITEEALKQLSRRRFMCPVRTRIVDAFSLPLLKEKFDGVYAGLWLSHVPKQRIDEFLTSIHQCLNSGAMVLFLDNSLAQCRRLPISHTDSHGNTFQKRKLANGSVHTILKNFPSENELMEAIKAFGTNPLFMELDNFWLLQYRAL